MSSKSAPTLRLRVNTDAATPMVIMTAPPQELVAKLAAIARPYQAVAQGVAWSEINSTVRALTAAVAKPYEDVCKAVGATLPVSDLAKIGEALAPKFETTLVDPHQFGRDLGKLQRQKWELERRLNAAQLETVELVARLVAFEEKREQERHAAEKKRRRQRTLDRAVWLVALAIGAAGFIRGFFQSFPRPARGFSHPPPCGFRSRSDQSTNSIPNRSIRCR